MTASRYHCPEALYGQHGEPTHSGRCPYCSTHLTSGKRPRNRAALRAHNLMEQDPLRIELDPDDEYWGH